MKKSNKNNLRICPVEMAGGLDNPLRKIFQNPKKILCPYIKPGMTVLNIGCGPGFFTLQIAKMLHHSGKIIAADLQYGMLEIIKNKIKGTDIEDRIILHQCQDDSINLKEKVDFVLAFYMIHEVANQEKLFDEIKTILSRDGLFLIIEPKFHVSKDSFNSMVMKIMEKGFETQKSSKVFFSRTVLFKKAE